MPKYATLLTQHLTEYKKLRLGIKESGVFVRGSTTVHRGHILPKELQWLNIVESYRAECRRYVEAHKHVKLHKYFHHLNSSQALALNLFLPFMENDHSTCLLRALGIKGSAVAWRAEHVVEPKEGTSVDISWLDAAGRSTYCEVKLSEQEFGTTVDDYRHRAKLDEIYRPELSTHCSAELLEPTAFFANYQVLRNLWLAARDPGATVLFLLPRRNEALWEALGPVLSGVSASLAKRVHVAALEDVLAKLVSQRSTPPRMAWYAEQLAEKYLIPDARA